MNMLTALEKAIHAGYTARFYFDEGALKILDQPNLPHQSTGTVRAVMPCLINRHTVYLITTDHGIRGVAILPWPECIPGEDLE